MKKKMIVTLLLSAGVFCAFLYSLNTLRAGHRQEGRERLEEAVRRAAVACYAAEGAYPQTLDPLIDRFGLQIGGGYDVIYEAQASNLMPNITVVERVP